LRPGEVSGEAPDREGNGVYLTHPRVGKRDGQMTVLVAKPRGKVAKFRGTEAQFRSQAGALALSAA
jgi:hypothetical protein